MPTTNTIPIIQLPLPPPHFHPSPSSRQCAARTKKALFRIVAQSDRSRGTLVNPEIIRIYSGALASSTSAVKGPKSTWRFLPGAAWKGEGGEGGETYVSARAREKPVGQGRARWDASWWEKMNVPGPILSAAPRPSEERRP